MDIKAFKMDGLGNDFVIIDQRRQDFNLNKDQIVKVCDRSFIGCDQLILIKKNKEIDANLEFYNSNGSVSGACGNGTRCVADLLSKESNKKEITLLTASGSLKSKILGNNLVETEIGIPKLNWQEIPLSKQLDTQDLKIEIINSELQRVPNNYKKITVEQSKNVLKLLDLLEENDDVQQVFHNMELSEEIMMAMDN